MFLRNPFIGAFGLDIGDLTIKLIQLERRRNSLFGPAHFAVKELRTVNLPPGYIVNGEIQQPEMVRKKLLFLLGRDGGGSKPINCPWVVADLPEPKTFLKLIYIDLPAAELTTEDISFHAKKHLPFELEDTYLDWQVISQCCDNRDRKVSQVLIGAVPKIIADSYTYLLESVGLSPLALEVEALAIARAMVDGQNPPNLPTGQAGGAWAILDLGATRSGLIVFDHGTTQFNTNISFSGELITTAIAQELKIDYSAAEDLKVNNGLNFDRAHPRYLKIIADLTDGLVEEIKKIMMFYQEHFKEASPITRVSLCGGMARLKNLAPVISRKLKVSARPDSVWKNLLNPQIKEKESDLVLASAVGLALRAAENPLKEKKLAL